MYLAKALEAEFAGLGKAACNANNTWGLTVIWII
jgi:hypothetical protein